VHRLVWRLAEPGATLRLVSRSLRRRRPSPRKRSLRRRRPSPRKRSLRRRRPSPRKRSSTRTATLAFLENLELATRTTYIGLGREGAIPSLREQASRPTFRLTLGEKPPD
jgi:hypothetical protein